MKILSTSFVVLALATLAAPAAAQELLLPGDWVVVGRQHVRDGAESDLAVLDASQTLAEIRVCAEGNDIRLRNAVAWLEGNKRQRLWLPLVIGAAKCSDPIAVQGAPARVTHVLFDYEALGLGIEGAHLVIAGLPAAR